ncbi:pyridoxamine 5'-phosphate oxidase family protein [Phytohabitans aurantiacus]|uniref:Pyridoxamine 5'-phosphate oxidase n=1 Tax=Phytohabitans aurantiacus TaxID=3016789 RepID=A0ABQ5QX90_9ACTN|nr:pyridoxamine 5'-phosphate oxidase family protein [Phytohabitans aurantiacus]GLH99145.1 pyridoxamine 5'-phosphate oxidase [Phytohabitans aurantiacus]
MASWAEVEADAPEFAAAVRRLLDAHRHKTLATLRRDGSPRISGTEAQFRDGELWFGGMWLSRKALDLRRDPRFALHSASVDPDDDDPAAWPGDAKLSGRVEEITDPARVSEVNKDAPPGPSHLFRADITEVVLTKVGSPADHLLIQWWREGKGLRVFKRT